jgi:type I restriction enzyme S subunit
VKVKGFLDNFRYVAEAPNAVTQLRAMILQLAVSGQLVEQRPEEESASAWIAKSDLPLMPIQEDSNASVPNGWMGLRLGNLLTSNLGGGTPSKHNPHYWGGDIAWASVKDINPDQKYLENTIDCITELGLKNSPSNLIPPRRLIVVTRMGLGKVAINTIPVAINQDLRALQPVRALDLDYAYIWAKAQAFSGKGVTVKGITIKQLHRQRIKLPPLQEQKRIVAKVDELMALCDRLEAQQHQRQRLFTILTATYHPHFLESSLMGQGKLDLGTLVSFDANELRKSIRSLAVTGRLSARCTEDAQSDETFGSLVSLHQEDQYNHFPPNWKRCRFRHLTSLVTSGSRGWKRYFSSAGAIFIRTQNIKTDALLLDDLQYVELPQHIEGQRTRVEKDDILITITGANVTKCALVEEDIGEAYVSQHIALARPIDTSLAGWLHLCLVSPAAGRGDLERAAYGDKPGLNLTNIRDLIFPIPPLAEQKRIVAKVAEFMTLIEKLEEKRLAKSKVADAFAQAAVAAITGTTSQESKPMNAPQTELVTRLEVDQTRNRQPGSEEPLASLLAEHDGSLTAKALWQRSGLAIDAFYQQLKTEMAAGWILEPERAEMREVASD